jgi:hypothetical protein
MRTRSRKRQHLENPAVASWIVLDWDQDQFHIAIAQSSRRGVQITRAVTWTHPEPFTPSTAERVGKALRDFLKVQKIVPAPVIVGLGRDRIFLKELRFPPLAAHEEASLVRFQTGKEMAESVESYAIDYVHLKNGDSNCHVMTVAVRRDYITMLQTLCQAAGLKLHAVTPKLFGMALALDRAVQPDAKPLAPKQLNVVLNIGTRWAELCFFRGGRLLQAQALANGPLMTNEVKRNVAVFLAQYSVNLDLEPPECLYVFGDDPAALEQLKSGQMLPLKVLDPLKPDAEAPENPAHFAGAAGLAALWSDTDQRPVNLASPKRSQAPVTAFRQRGYIYGTAAAVAAVFLIGMAWYVLYAKRTEIARLEKEKIELETEWNSNTVAQARAELDSYKEWENTTISPLDELYDLSARFPYKKDFRVNTLGITAGGGQGKKAPGKDNYVAKITLAGVALTNDSKFVEQLRGELLKDAHLRTDMGTFKQNKTYIDYDLKIDVAKQDASKFTVVMEKPVQTEKIVYELTPGKKVYVTKKKQAETKKGMPTEPPVDPDDDGGQP